MQPHEIINIYFLAQELQFMNVFYFFIEIMASIIE